MQKITIRDLQKLGLTIDNIIIVDSKTGTDKKTLEYYKLTYEQKEDIKKCEVIEATTKVDFNFNSGCINYYSSVKVRVWGN